MNRDPPRKLAGDPPPAPAVPAITILGASSMRWIIANGRWQNDYLKAINDSINGLADAVGQLTDALETGMATIADLKTQVDALVAGDKALATEAQAQMTAVTELEAAISGLRGKSALSVEDQATLDSTLQKVVDTTSNLATQTASLQTSQAGATAAANPVPTPTPPTPPTPAPPVPPTPTPPA